MQKPQPFNGDVGCRGLGSRHPQEQKKVLVSGYIGFSNFGDDAIFSSLAEHLKKSGCEVSALSSNPALTRENFGVEAFKFNNVFQVLKAIKNCDILFSGGGSLLQNTTSNKSLIYYLLIILLAKMFGKKVVIFAQGIGPIKGASWQALTRFVLKMCDIVTVRNSFSQRLLGKWKIESKLVCDPVFEIETPPYSPENIVGVQLRPYNKMEKSNLQNLARAIGKNFTEKAEGAGWKIQIFPFQKNLDEKICINFYDLLKKEYPQIEAEIVPYQSIEQVMQKFSHLDYLFAMRFHAALLGLKTGVKTLPVSYDEKVVNLAQDYQIDYVEADKKVDFESVIKKFIENGSSAKNIKNVLEVKFDWEYFSFLIK